MSHAYAISILKARERKMKKNLSAVPKRADADGDLCTFTKNFESLPNLSGSIELLEKSENCPEDCFHPATDRCLFCIRQKGRMDFYKNGKI